MAKKELKYGFMYSRLDEDSLKQDDWKMQRDLFLVMEIVV